MTTPAVSDSKVDEVFHSVTTTTTHTGSTSSDHGLHDASRHERFRPASVSNPASPINGWRNPSGFYHYGFQMIMPKGTYSYDQYVSTPSLYAHSEFKDFIWSGVTASSPTLPSADVKNRAVNAALSKIKAQKVNLGQMVLEAGETSRLITSTINKVTNLTKAFKQKSPAAFLWAKTVGSTPGHRGSKIPDAYLEYVYGYKPLVQDAYGIVDELNSRGQSKPPAMTVSSKATSIDAGQFSIDNTSSAGGNCRMIVSRRTTQTVKVRLDLELVNPFTATLSSLGILNPVALAWERLPYSFVADWFVPIGTYLGNLDAGLGYQFKGGSISQIT